jgi:putative transcriptional regulator
MNERTTRLPLAQQIRKGLEEAIRHAKGEITLKTTVVELPDPPPEIEAGQVTSLRLESRMSQAVFARVLNVSTKTVQSWEHGTRRPSQAALRLIQVFGQNPGAVLQVAGMTENGVKAISTGKTRSIRARRSGSR